MWVCECLNNEEDDDDAIEKGYHKSGKCDVPAIAFSSAANIEFTIFNLFAEPRFIITTTKYSSILVNKKSTFKTHTTSTTDMATQGQRIVVLPNFSASDIFDSTINRYDIYCIII